MLCPPKHCLSAKEGGMPRPPTACVPIVIGAIAIGNAGSLYSIAIATNLTCLQTKK
jgi:hypothetical protein